MNFITAQGAFANPASTFDKANVNFMREALTVDVKHNERFTA